MQHKETPNFKWNMVFKPKLNTGFFWMVYKQKYPNKNKTKNPSFAQVERAYFCPKHVSGNEFQSWPTESLASYS